MNENRPLKPFRALKSLTEFPDVVSVDGSDVLESEFLEEYAVDYGVFYILLGVVDSGYYAVADYRNLGQTFLYSGLHVDVLIGTCYASQGPGQSARILRNGHAVVVQHDDEVSVHASGVVERLVCETACHGSVPDYRDHLVVVAI